MDGGPTEGVYASEEDFHTALYELGRVWAAYTAASGPAASEPLLRDCVLILDRLAYTLEEAEADYRSTPGRIPHVNHRTEHTVGVLLGIFSDTDDFPEEVITGMLLGASRHAQTVASRALVAAAPVYADKAPPAIFQVLREETAFEQLSVWVTEGEGALRVFATGLLATLMLDRDVADYIVRTPIAQTLLQRLRTPPDPAPPEPDVPLLGISGPELARRGLQYNLLSLAGMGEYQEILTPLFQEEGLGVVMKSLQLSDLPCCLAAIEMTARLLAHKKFSNAFVANGGVEVILALSDTEHTFQLHGSLAMCLFGLGSLASVFETVCRLPTDTLTRVVAYAISLLRCPQEPTQKSIVLFFGLALAFRPVLDQFDADPSQGGLYCLLNLLRAGMDALGSSPQAAATGQRRGQLAHYTILCLRHYLRIHLALFAAASDAADAEPPVPPGAKRPRLNSHDSLSSSVPSSYYRPVEVDDNLTEALLTRVRTGTLALPPDWAPVKTLLHHRGLLVLLGVVASSSTGRTGAAETARYALDCLEVATLVPSALHEACLAEAVDQRTGMQVLLEAASGLAQRDAEVMRGALRVLCNCLCGPYNRQEGAGGADGEEERVRRAIRKDLRSKDGIKVLVSLLRYRRCIQVADEVRMLAARCLLGLSHEAAIAQILEKLRLSLLLSEVVRAGPVLERASDHYQTLRAAAMQLIAKITGRPTCAASHSDAMDPASWKLEKAAIVTRTPITYDPQDLLVLIRDHLMAQGLANTARALEVEAGLPEPPPPLLTEASTSAHAHAHKSAPPPYASPSSGSATAAVDARTSRCTSHQQPHHHQQQPQQVELKQPFANFLSPPPRTTAAGARRAAEEGAPSTSSSAVATPAGTDDGGSIGTDITTTNSNNNHHNATHSTHRPSFTSPTTTAPSTTTTTTNNHNAITSSSSTTTSTLPPSFLSPHAPIRPFKRMRANDRPASPTRTHTHTHTTPIPPLTVRRVSSPVSSLTHTHGHTHTTHHTQPRQPIRVHSSSSLSSSNIALRHKQQQQQQPPKGMTPEISTPSLLDLPSPFPALTRVPSYTPTHTHTHTHPHTTTTTLDQIVVNFLRRQHEQCPNPVCVLPPLSLTLPHRCPEPPATGAAVNVAKRLMQRQAVPPYGGFHGRKRTRALVYTRFRPWRSYREEGGHSITCTAFPRGPPGRLWAGTDDGTIRLFDLWTSDVEGSWDCHGCRITSMATSPSQATHRPALLTCAAEPEYGEMQSETCLWSALDPTTPLFRVGDMRAAVFDSTGVRIAGLVNENVVQVYDAELGTHVRTLTPTETQTTTGPPSRSLPNVCFSPTHEQLLLCDGMLWDVRVPSVVHRFDKLSNGANYGVFHPDGRDVIIDGTVWDLWTHSLRTVIAGTDQSILKFSGSGEVIYAYRSSGTTDDADFRPKRPRELTQFTVLDASDYSVIQVHEAERQILDIAVDDRDLYLSVVEGQATAVGPFLSEDAICRLYEVGRRRPNEADSDIDDAHSDSEEDDDDWAGGEEEEDTDMELDLGDGPEEDDDSEDDDNSEAANDAASVQENGAQGDDAQAQASGASGHDGAEGTGDDDGDVGEESSADSSSSGSGSSGSDDDDDDDGGGGGGGDGGSEGSIDELDLLLAGEFDDDDDEEGESSYHGEDDSDDDDDDESNPLSHIR